MQVAALDDSSHTVETTLFMGNLRPVTLHDAELVIGRVINSIPGFDTTLRANFATEQKTAIGDIAAVGYSTDPLVTEKVCSMYHISTKKGREVSLTHVVSVRRLDSGVAAANGLLDTEINTLHMLYFHESAMRDMRVSHGETALVVPHAVFRNDTKRFDFSLTQLRRQQ